MKRKSKFEYHVEDCDCKYCLHKGKTKKQGCTRSECCCADIKREAAENGRIKRKRGWDK